MAARSDVFVNDNNVSVNLSPLGSIVVRADSGTGLVLFLLPRNNPLDHVGVRRADYNDSLFHENATIFAPRETVNKILLSVELLAAADNDAILGTTC